MRQNVSKFMIMLTLALLLIGMLVFTLSTVSADDGDIPLIGDPSRIGTESPGLSGLGQTVNSGIYSLISGNIIFEQPPKDSTYAYTSDTLMGYLCLDDFWGLTAFIDDLHWYGLTLIWNDNTGFSSGDPTGMQFEIIFYEDNGGSPGFKIADFHNISPAINKYDTFYGYQTCRFDVTGLGVPSSLTEGWVSIQSTYSPSNSSFLWLNTATGNGNAIQNGDPLKPVGNLSFALTKSPPQGVGGEVEAVNMVTILIPLAGLAIVLVLSIYLVVKKANRCI